MSTKAQIQALIDTKLADTSDIIASELREVENAQLNENFNAQVTQTGTVSPVAYNLKFTKKGNYCILSGEITNTLQFIGGFGVTIPITPTFAFPLVNTRFIANRTVGGNSLPMNITSAGNIVVAGTIGAGDTYFFNLTYTINS